MLTKKVVNTVKAIDALSKQLASIQRDREELILSIKQAILEDDTTCGMDYIEITGLSIVDEPVGPLRQNGWHAIEKCDDSIYMPDSGCGILCWPIEDEKWLRIDYDW